LISWNITTKKIELKNIVGEFTAGETLTGQTSGASYKISYEDEFDTRDKYAQNDEIDFSEINPFGMV